METFSYCQVKDCPGVHLYSINASTLIIAEDSRPVHCFLYGEEFVSVNAVGMVSVLSVPDLPFVTATPVRTGTTTKNAELVNPMKQNLVSSSTSLGDYMEVNMQATSIETLNPAEARLENHKLVLSSRLCNSEDHQE